MTLVSQPRGLSGGKNNKPPNKCQQPTATIIREVRHILIQALKPTPPRNPATLRTLMGKVPLNRGLLPTPNMKVPLRIDRDLLPQSSRNHNLTKAPLHLNQERTDSMNRLGYGQLKTRNSSSKEAT